MKILVSGLCGHMGAELAKLILAEGSGHELAGGVSLFGCEDGTAYGVPCSRTFADAVDGADCIIDFSHHDATAELLAFAKAKKLPLVLATTGQTAEEKAAIADAAKEIPLFFASNYSLGIALLVKLAKITAAAMPDAEVEIIEKHHDRKLDAPSGTALTLAEAVREARGAGEFKLGRSGQCKRTKSEIGIHAVRMGNIVGEHEVIIGTNNQIITLKHEALSRALFAEGALTAAAWLVGKGPGLYDMNSLLAD